MRVRVRRACRLSFLLARPALHLRTEIYAERPPLAVRQPAAAKQPAAQQGDEALEQPGPNSEPYGVEHPEDDFNKDAAQQHQEEATEAQEETDEWVEGWLEEQDPDAWQPAGPATTAPPTSAAGGGDGFLAGEMRQLLQDLLLSSGECSLSLEQVEVQGAVTADAVAELRKEMDTRLCAIEKQLATILQYIGCKGAPDAQGTLQCAQCEVGTEASAVGAPAAPAADAGSNGPANEAFTAASAASTADKAVVIKQGGRMTRAAAAALVSMP